MTDEQLWEHFVPQFPEECSPETWQATGMSWTIWMEMTDGEWAKVGECRKLSFTGPLTNLFMNTAWMVHLFSNISRLKC